MTDGTALDVSLEDTNGELEKRFVERFPYILAQPDKSQLAEYVVQEWQACVEWLHTCRCNRDQREIIEMLTVAGKRMQRQVSRPFPLPPISFKEAKAATRGDTENTPIYGMLLHLAAAQSNPDRLRLIRPLAAQILLAHATLIYLRDEEELGLDQNSRSSKPPVPSSVPACRLIRQLAEGRHYELAEKLPVNPSVFTDAYERIRAKEHDPQRKYDESFAAACVTISDARERHGKRRTRISSKRGPSEGRTSQRTRSVGGNDDEAKRDLQGSDNQHRDNPKIHDRWARVKASVASGEQELPATVLSDAQAHEYRQSGLSAEEVQPERKTLRSSTLRGERPGGSLPTRVRCQQGMLKDRARVNQRLPIHPSAIRREELAKLVEWLWQKMARGTVESLDETSAEATAMLAMVLTTGSTPEELHSLKIVNDETTIPERDTRSLVLSRDGRLYLWVHVPAPEMHPNLYAEVSDLLHPVSEGLLLPLPDPLVAGLKNIREKVGSYGTQAMFSMPLDQIKSAASRHLQSINEEFHTQLRLSRLSTVLPRVINDLTGNSSYGWIVCGDGDPHTHTPLVYQTTSAPTLVAIYEQALAEILNRPFAHTEEKDAEPRHFGSALRGIDGVWSGIATELREGIPSVPYRRAGADEHIAHHNAYVLYILIMALVGTGVRVARDPIESVLDIDWEHGLLFVQDKEAHARPNQRIIPLPPSVLDQLKAYRRHLQALAERMNQVNPDVSSKLRAADSGEDLQIPFLLFLEPDLSVLPIRPKTLTPRFQNVFCAPVNIGRHHLRSHLVATKCPGEWIEALMGHEPTGMEALGPYSALSVQDMRQIAEQWIEPMLQEHGWTIVRGVPA